VVEDIDYSCAETWETKRYVTATLGNKEACGSHCRQGGAADRRTPPATPVKRRSLPVF
jgi:hypothetical protein